MFFQHQESFQLYRWMCGLISWLDVLEVYQSISCPSDHFIDTCFISHSGIVGTFVGHPIDTIKVRQQCHFGGNSLTARQCVQRAFKNEGVLMRLPYVICFFISLSFFLQNGYRQLVYLKDCRLPSARQQL